MRFTPGPFAIDLDGLRVIAQAPATLQIGAVGGAVVEVLEVEDRFLLDCGEPLPGVLPMVVADLRDTAGPGSDLKGVRTFEAESTWFLELVANPDAPCVVTVRTADGETVRYSAFGTAALAMSITGSISVDAVAGCFHVRALSGTEALTEEPVVREGDRDGPWPAAFLPSGVPGSGTSDVIVILNTGDEVAILSGWTLRDDTGSQYEFPFGTSLDPGRHVFVVSGCGNDAGLLLFACRDDAGYAGRRVALVDVSGRDVGALVASAGEPTERQG